jgi:threonine dehydratase
LVSPALNVDQTPAEVFDVVRSSDVEIVQVADEEIAACSLWLNGHGIFMDPAASAALACSMFHSIRRRYRDLALIMTGRSAKFSLSRLVNANPSIMSSRRIAREIGRAEIFSTVCLGDPSSERSALHACHLASQTLGYRGELT